MTTRQLIITAGAKGGSGKSLTTTVLHAWLQTQKIRTVAIDGDNENSTLSRFLPESRFIDMREPAAIDSILSPITTEEAEVVLLDSRAATSEEMVRWLKQMDIQAINTDLNIAICSAAANKTAATSSAKAEKERPIRGSSTFET
jgi:cellulose biosynthesis protein BcsQ